MLLSAKKKQVSLAAAEPMPAWEQPWPPGFYSLLGKSALILGLKLAKE